jgi:hypothetical protein
VKRQPAEEYAKLLEDLTVPILELKEVAKITGISFGALCALRRRETKYVNAKTAEALDRLRGRCP